MMLSYIWRVYLIWLVSQKILSCLLHETRFFLFQIGGDDHKSHFSSNLLHALRVRLLRWLQLLTLCLLALYIFSWRSHFPPCFWLNFNSHMCTPDNSWWLMICGCRSAVWKQIKPPHTLLCFWFECCSLSLAIQSSWLITQPIAASGQSQALYDSPQTTDRGAHSARFLFAHTHTHSRSHIHTRAHTLWVVGSILSADCIGYCRVSLWRSSLRCSDDVGKRIMDFKGWGQCTMNISHVTIWSESLYHPHMR